MNNTPKSAKRTTAAGKTYEGFTDEERAAMKERARELKPAGRRGRRPDEADKANKPNKADKADKADGEGEVLAKIAEMQEHDRALAATLHAIIKAAAPALSPRTWYGMPAYAKDGNVICFFQPAQKFKTRYATLGFSDKASLDDGAIWPTYYAVTELTAATEEMIGALVRKALS
jgi:uncharacterized protein YdhG (YjbR/CyaY superfamily)